MPSPPALPSGSRLSRTRPRSWLTSRRRKVRPASATRGELAIYTGGFPPPTLLDALSAACSRKPSLELRHWGDADVGGLRIWWLIRSRLGAPLPLYRTRAEWLETVSDGERVSTLDQAERASLQRLRSQLLADGSSTAPAVGDAVRLIDVLLDRGCKVEQERW